MTKSGVVELIRAEFSRPLTPGGDYPECAERIYDALQSAHLLAGDEKPIGWVFQHEETGQTEIVDIQQVEWGFEKNNPRMQKIRPVYDHPSPRPEPTAGWTGCGECDCTFSCYEGKARCIRLPEPTTGAVTCPTGDCWMDGTPKYTPPEALECPCCGSTDLYHYQDDDRYRCQECAAAWNQSRRTTAPAVASGWKTIDSAPHCVAGGNGDNGRRPVIVTRHPSTGIPPMAIARLTTDGWICGKMGNKLWFEPTHWQPLPSPPTEGGGSE